MGAKVSFDIGKFGGVSYKWEFGDGGLATGVNVTHIYFMLGTKMVKLMVIYVDGVIVFKDVLVTVDVFVVIIVMIDVGVFVDMVLLLLIGMLLSFGVFMFLVVKDYEVFMMVKVIATSGDVIFIVSDTSVMAIGYLVNG